MVNIITTVRESENLKQRVTETQSQLAWRKFHHLPKSRFTFQCRFSSFLSGGFPNWVNPRIKISLVVHRGQRSNTVARYRTEMPSLPSLSSTSVFMTPCFLFKGMALILFKVKAACSKQINNAYSLTDSPPTTLR